MSKDGLIQSSVPTLMKKCVPVLYSAIAVRLVVVVYNKCLVNLLSGF